MRKLSDIQTVLTLIVTLNQRDCRSNGLSEYQTVSSWTKTDIGIEPSDYQHVTHRLSFSVESQAA